MKISNILYINLDKRKDRLKHVKKELSKINLKGERFPAIKLKNGRLGCSMSHLKCIEIAKKRDWDHVFVCEDDITFTNPSLFLKQLNKFFKSRLEWNVILVAGNNIPPYKRFGNFCIQVSHCQTTTGYIVRKEYYDVLIQNFKEGIEKLIRKQSDHLLYAIDRKWTELQRKDKWYLIIPASVIQRPDYSDIENKYTDYSWHLTDINKIEYLKKQQEEYLKKQEFLKKQRK